MLPFKDTVEKVNKKLGELDLPAELHEFVLRGGKRIRPIFFLLLNDDIRPAIALELIHASTLVHDDLMDEDEKRRGKLSLHMSLMQGSDKKTSLYSSNRVRIGISQAILRGNMLLAKAFELVSFSEHYTNILAKSYYIVNEGQSLDLLFEDVEELSERQYSDLIDKKTAQLFMCALEMAVPEDKNLILFGKYFGRVFQITDDFLDDEHGYRKDVLREEVGKAREYLSKSSINDQTKKSFEEILKKVVKRKK